MFCFLAKCARLKNGNLHISSGMKQRQNMRFNQTKISLTSDMSDQWLYCLHKECLTHYVSTEHIAKILILSLCFVHTHFLYYVVAQLYRGSYMRAHVY